MSLQVRQDARHPFHSAPTTGAPLKNGVHIRQLASALAFSKAEKKTLRRERL
jgi:hypothetical protein